VNSGTAQREKMHRLATRQAAQLDCLLCGRPAPSMPCHFPGGHRGMGAGKAGWERNEWWPGCHVCHEAVDARNGTSVEAEGRTRYLRALLSERTLRVWRP